MKSKIENKTMYVLTILMLLTCLGIELFSGIKSLPNGQLVNDFQFYLIMIGLFDQYISRKNIDNHLSSAILLIFSFLILNLILFELGIYIPNYIILILSIVMMSGFFIHSIIKDTKKVVIVFVCIVVSIFSISYISLLIRPFKDFETYYTSLNRTDKQSLHISENVNSISGVETFREIHSISISSKNIHSYKPLEQMVNLERIILRKCDFKKIELLDNLPNVIDVTLDEPFGTEIPLYKIFSNVRQMSIFNFNTQNLVYLSNLNSLEYLELTSIKIDNLDGIQNLDNLKKVHLYNVTVENIDFLLENKNINEIIIEKCTIKKILDLKTQSKHINITIVE